MNKPDSYVILLLPKVIDNLLFKILSQAAKIDFAKTDGREKEERGMVSFFLDPFFNVSVNRPCLSTSYVV